MALTEWMFLYAAPGAPEAGQEHVVATPACRTVTVGFPSADAALAAARDGLVARHPRVQLLELCGAFDAGHVAALRALLPPHVPVGRVVYGDDMQEGLRRVFG